MKTIIIYSTTHGTTKKVSNMISKIMKQSGDDVEVIDAKDIKKYNLRVFNRIILGGSIHKGQIQKDIKKVSADYKTELKEKELGLFITCMMNDKDVQEEQLRRAYSEELREHSKAKGILGGEYLFEKMNLLEKMIVKVIVKANKTISSINKDAINQFAKDMIKK